MAPRSGPPSNLTRSLRNALLAAAGAALLASCARIGNIRPTAKVLTPPPSAVKVTWPHTDWWRQFGDRQLNALVARATTGNPTLHLAEARASAAAAEAQSVDAGLLPSVNGALSLQRIRFSGRQLEPPPFADNWWWNNSATVGMSYDLDVWGEQHQNYAAALGSAAAAAVNTREARLALQTAVVRSYISLSRALALRDIARRDLKREQGVLGIARQRFDAGIGTRLDVSQASTPIPDTRAQIEVLDASIAALRHQLAALVGDPAPDALANLAPQIVLTAKVALPANVPANLLGHRPDVVAARLQVLAAGHGVEAARDAFYPDINLSAAAGFVAFGFTHLLSFPAAQMDATPAISLPIFEGGKLRAGLRGASAEYDMAVDQYNATVLDALQGTADDITQLKSLARQAKHVRESLADARVTFDEAERGFRSGLTNQLNVLEAENTLLTEEQKLAEVKASRLTQYALLMQALGGGFDVREVGAANANGTGHEVGRAGDDP